MEIRDLEFRGIKIEHLGMYFEELGAKQVTDKFPYIYEAENWRGYILSEEEISFTSIFKVNTVKVRFCANEAQTLDELIKNYRYKTTRIGG
ncbi:hypothetical protein [Neobacillus sp. SuZ13]|uniref:hypothetical protein n=1 Tax=Neobacillus sp. SuZ13 TaxID=3047875 RepID=UPI0024C055C5|nr:hypothetical protein [Neobacillus sp. SuZ13]WHY68326.1 hypothetical protein QNH17_06760 [Neobacillus sp. SuZ13]